MRKSYKSCPRFSRVMGVRLEHMRDLGVIFDSELNFVQHCKEKINTSYLYLRIIKSNFIYLDENVFVMLHKGLVISHFRIYKFCTESVQTWINVRSRKSPDASN